MSPKLINAKSMPPRKGRPRRWIPLVQRLVGLGQNAALIWTFKELQVEASGDGKDIIRTGFYKAARRLGVHVSVQFEDPFKVAVRFVGMRVA